MNRTASSASVITTTESILSASGLRKTYGRGSSAVQAVAGIDLELAPGELVAIMGASGSGKTTLLHLLAGLVRADAGRIRLANIDLATASDAAITSARCRHIGVVFQAYNLMPTLSALDNVALPLMLAGTRRGKAREVARRRLDEVGMGEKTGRRPAALSGGEQQRVAVARALAADPQIVLADEPTGNLDRKNAQEICRIMRNVATGSGRAVAVVTHEPAVAAHADRVVVLADGRIADSFSRAEVDSAEALGLRCLRVATAE